jgi:hypothetical protein
MTRDKEQLAEMYWRVIRVPTEGTAGAAIRCHAQACGFVAYAFDVHPDTVARAVALATQSRERSAGRIAA